LRSARVPLFSAELSGVRARSQQVEELVFLLDVDNTLLDNDRVTADLRHFRARNWVWHADRYFDIFETLRRRLRRLPGCLAAVSQCHANRPARPVALAFPDRLPVR
jgi:hypothetical protein